MLDDARVAKAMQFVAGQRRDPRHVERVVLVDRGGAQRVRKPGLAKQLHAAAVGDVHLRMDGRRAVSLDQDRSDALLRQIDGERHSDRSAAGDENRRKLHPGRPAKSLQAERLSYMPACTTDLAIMQ